VSLALVGVHARENGQLAMPVEDVVVELKAYIAEQCARLDLQRSLVKMK